MKIIRKFKQLFYRKPNFDNIETIVNYHIYTLPQLLDKYGHLLSEDQKKEIEQRLLDEKYEIEE